MIGKKTRSFTRLFARERKTYNGNECSRIIKGTIADLERLNSQINWKKYLRKAEADNMNLNELVKLDDPVLAHRMCGGNAAYSDPRFDILSKRLDYITKELRKTGVTRYLIW